MAITDASRLANFASNVGTGVTFAGNDILVVGVVTATSFVGDGSGLTGVASTDNIITSTASTMADIYSTGIVTATSATFTGNVSIGGTLTYEDVTNIDSVGVITARSGIRIGAGQSIGSDGALTYYGDGAVVTGVITATSLSGAELVNYSEKVNLLNNTGSAATINVEDGNFVVATLDNNCTFTFSSVTSGKFYSFGLQLTNSGGSHSITWPTSVKWPGDSLPSRTTTSGRSDVYGFYTTDGGSNWYGSISQYNYN